MDILYVVLLFLQKKNKKELLCRNCGGNAGFTDGMADAYRKRLDAVLDSLYDHCNWNDVSVFMDWRQRDKSNIQVKQILKITQKSQWNLKIRVVK